MQTKYLNKSILLLPFAFALHNLEEALTIAKWSISNPNFYKAPVSTKQFLIAVILFTILGFLVTFSKRLYFAERYYYFVITGFAGMIMMNVIFPHLLGGIYLKKYTPGLITGLVINLPLTIYILMSLIKTNKVKIKQMILFTITGCVSGSILAFLFIQVGKLFV
jgi:hypothetical protein